MEGEKRRVENVSFRWWRKMESLREPPASRRLLTTFSHMDNHIGGNLIELRWPPGEMEFAHALTPDALTPGEKSLFYRDSNSQPELSLDYEPSAFTGCAVSAPGSM